MHLRADEPHRRSVDLTHLLTDRAEEVGQGRRVGVLTHEHPTVRGLAADRHEAEFGGVQFREAAGVGYRLQLAVRGV